ncbi:MAG: Ferrous-iron efflux pump FieF [Pelotomaculum sp. PtaU1.Bin035]|nr:MAG: Ferrous-iron efflux pump FieF [Pelotomaculum sp. PtaU1.Bin035]
MNEKLKAACLSITSNLFLTTSKLAIGITMNSVSVISESIHSGLDLIAALIAFFSVKESSKPADERHHYGHGKYENIASIVEALLIIIAALIIIFNAFPKLYGRAVIHSLDLGAAVMGISAIINIFVSRKLFIVSRETESPALAADAWHLRTDVYTSFGVLAGIAAIKLTGLTIIDPLIAIGVAFLILKSAVELIRDSMSSILDAGLPEEEEQVIRDVLNKNSLEFVEFHKLRTRKAGSQRYVDLHLVVPARMVINKTHLLCDQIEKEISSKLGGIHVLIHAEPCGENCIGCCMNINGQSKDIKCGSSHKKRAQYEKGRK